MHKQILINDILIDEEIVELIKLLWKNKFETKFSCQNLGNRGNIWLGFSNENDLIRFIKILLKTGDFCSKVNGKNKVSGFYTRTFSNQYYVEFPRSWKNSIEDYLKNI